MNPTRVYTSADHFQPAPGEPIRSVISESPDATVVAWHVDPGQTIASHVHPRGQDTWTILGGQGEYIVHVSGESRTIVAGDVVLARTGDVHGVTNRGSEPLRFISVVCPADAGYEPL